MKTILLWDKRLPRNAPDRLSLPDELASAAVRSGAAAAANPAEAGLLSAGPALDAGQPIEVVLQHGNGLTSRVMLPSSVAAVAGNLGIAASTGTPLAGGVVTPPPVPAPSFTSLPTVSGAITAGQAVNVVAVADGVVANGAVTARTYLLAGVPVAAGYVTQPADAGKAVTVRNTATGTDGSTIQVVSTTSVIIAVGGSTAPYTPSVTTPGMSVFPSAGPIASA